jgi:outer membrane immunogenic protein
LTLHFIARRTEMRLQISIFALSAALCASAFAADLPVRTNAPAPMPVFVAANWTGFYLGANVGYAWADASLRNSGPPGPPARTVGADSDGVIGGLQAGYDWQMGSLVLGFVADVHGGVAFAGVEGNWVGGPWNGSGDKTRTGWVAGGGLEYKWTQNLSAFTEYSYAVFGSYSFANVGGPAVRFDNDIRVQTIKVGFNYRFGGPAGAVVARY